MGSKRFLIGLSFRKRGNTPQIAKNLKEKSSDEVKIKKRWRGEGERRTESNRWDKKLVKRGNTPSGEKIEKEGEQGMEIIKGEVR